MALKYLDNGKAVDAEKVFVDNLELFILKVHETRFVLDDKSKDDLYQHIKQLKIQRSWVASKVAQRDYTQVERFPACDEFVEPKGAY